MIHSLSGGVIADSFPRAYAKVEICGAPYWYLAPFEVAAGDRVLAPFGKDDRLVEATVLRVETCGPDTAPVPFSRAKSLEKCDRNI